MSDDEIKAGGIKAGECPRCGTFNSEIVPLNGETMYVDLDTGIAYARDPFIHCKKCALMFNSEFPDDEGDDL